MFTIKIEHVTVQVVDNDKLDQILAHLTTIQRDVRDIKMTDQELKAVLDKIDATTTKVGDNVTAIGTVVQNNANVIQTVSDEIDALIAKGAISPESAAEAQALADKLQAVSDSGDAVVAAMQAQATVLQQVAEKGAPVTPPPPPPPTV